MNFLIGKIKRLVFSVQVTLIRNTLTNQKNNTELLGPDKTFKYKTGVIFCQDIHSELCMFAERYLKQKSDRIL